MAHIAIVVGQTSVVLVHCGGPLVADWSFLISVPSEWKGMVDGLLSWGMETSHEAITQRTIPVVGGASCVLLTSDTTA